MTKSKIFTGVLWASFQKFGNLAISFIANMILARLLTPNDFGAIGMLGIFITISQTLVDSGFGAALIQKQSIDDKDSSTIFYLNLSISFVLYIIIYLISPLIANFYTIPSLCDLLRVLSLVIIINALGLVQSVHLARDLNFRSISICHIVGAIIGVVFGVTLAYCGFGVWSLVLRTLATAIVTNILLWNMGRWKPIICFSKQSFKELFSFGGYIMLSNIILNISNNIQTLIIGKLFSPSNVGNYTQAKTLRDVTSDGISSVIGQVLYPDFSHHQNDDNVICDKLNKSIYMLSFIVFPLMIYLCVVADRLIPLVYGDQWCEAITYFQILCIGGIPLCLQRVNASVIQAKGKSKLFFICNIIKISIYIPFLIVGGSRWGMIGFLLVMVIYSTLSYLLFALIATRCINVGIVKQLSIVLRCLLLAMVSALIVVVCNDYLMEYSNIVLVIIDLFIYALSYCLLAHIFKTTALNYFKSYIKSIF